MSNVVEQPFSLNNIHKTGQGRDTMTQIYSKLRDEINSKLKFQYRLITSINDSSRQFTYSWWIFHIL